MATLTTQTAKINVIISLKECPRIDGVINRLKAYCEEYMNIYAFILHDKDLLEDGTIKTPHIHLCGLLKNNRRRLSSTLDDIATFCNVSTFAVTIDKMSDIVGSIQYLIHKNDSSKHQYDIKKIVTNISEGELNTYMNSDSKSISIEYLVDVVLKHRSKIDIMREIGLTYYHLYRNTINDIYKEIYETENYGLS